MAVVSSCRETSRPLRVIALANLTHIGEHLLDFRYYFGNTKIEMVNTEGSRDLSKELYLQSSVNNFMKLISPYIIDSMKYKILDPVTT